MRKIALSTYLTQNRTEELDSFDLWGRYVLPLSYKSLLDYRKSNHITGGRGTGKTAFIQYHCYQTRLSINKSSVTDDDLEDIGIYWKPDSSLLPDMTINALDTKLWKPIFHAYIGLSIIHELSIFLNYFCNSNYANKEVKDEICKIKIPKSYLSTIGISENDITFVELYSHVHLLRAQLNNWLCFSSDVPPFSFNAKSTIELFIDLIRNFEIFKQTRFHIFIDEFENLSIEHQQTINTWVKHIENNIIYHVAYKKHYQPTFETLGKEKIQVTNDYRVIDIERDIFSVKKDLSYTKDFKLLCAEIIINNLQKYYEIKFDFLEDFGDNYLSKEEYIKERKSSSYQDNIFKVIKQILPINTLNEISDELMNDEPLKKKVLESIATSLKQRKCEYTPKDFINIMNSSETILNAILLNRPKLICSELLKHFNEKSKKYQHWKDINQLGSILYFYNKFNHKVCSYYGGYDRFITQASFNVRHLLELFHKSILEAERNDLDLTSIDNLRIPVQLQAKAAKEVSSSEFNSKISACGNQGLSLKKITERLGKLFTLKQNDPAQSIAEINQFSIIYSAKETTLTEKMRIDIEYLLNELKIWSVVIEKDNTKVFNKLEHNSLMEYRLHPILSSFFQISPRQKRKFEFDMETVKIIFLSKDNIEFGKLYDTYAKNDIKTKKNTPSLLDIIDES